MDPEDARNSRIHWPEEKEHRCMGGVNCHLETIIKHHIETYETILKDARSVGDDHTEWLMQARISTLRFALEDLHRSPR